MSVLLPPPMFYQFFVPGTNVPAVGYKLFTYVANTSTPQPTWTDSTQTVQNANPIIADANGVMQLWIDPSLSYKFIFSPPNDTNPPTSPIYTTNSINSIGTSAVINIITYGADPTGTTTSAPAIQAAINAYPNGGIELIAPPGSYLIDRSIVFPWTWNLGSFTGSGFGTIFFMEGSSFDMFTWGNPGATLLSLTNMVLSNFSISGSSVSGSGNLINTQYASTIQMRDLFLSNLCTTGNGIAVNGNGSTYSHDIQISNIYFSTLTGNAVIFMGQFSSDSFIEKVVGNGNFGCNYGLYFSLGAAHHKIANCHAYNHLTNALYVGANSSGGHWFSGCRFEAAGILSGLAQDSAVLNGASNCTFTDCQFTYAPSTYSDLKLVNATGNKFANCAFVAAGGVTAYAINETGSSNGNVFNGFTTENTFAQTIPYVLVGPSSAIRQSGTDQIYSGGPTSLAASNTIYLSNGATATNINGSPSIYGGLATQYEIECETAPGSGQTFIGTLYINGSPGSTQTPLATTITASSASIACTNTYTAGQAVVFVGSMASITGLTANTTYFVIAAGLSGSAFEVSATQGGSAITPGGSSTATPTVVSVPVAIITGTGGAGAFLAQISGVLPVAANHSISMQIAASSGATTSLVRASMVINQ